MKNGTDKLRRAFTLVEVNLAVFVMSVSVLSLVALYSLGFREGRQSREDVAAAVFCNAVLSRIETALSSTNVAWSAWQRLPYFEYGGAGGQNGWVGWGDYAEVQFAVRTEVDEGAKHSWPIVRLRGAPSATAARVYGAVTGLAGAEDVGTAPPSVEDMSWALVVSRTGRNSPVLSAAVRAVRKRRESSLLSQPLYLTEIHFQGDPDR